MRVRERMRMRVNGEGNCPDNPYHLECYSSVECYATIV